MAGGKSKRFGGQIDKSLLPLEGKPLIQWVVERVGPLMEEVIIVSNEREKFTFLGVKVMSDIYPGYGSLSGLHTGLSGSRDFYNFVTACDSPFISPQLVEYLLSRKEGYDVVIPWLGTGQEPLFGIYSKNCLSPIEEQIKNGENLKIIGFFDQVKVCKILEREIRKIDSEFISFFNINTPEDYNKAKVLVRRKKQN